jgi:hypothetical protein
VATACAWLSIAAATMLFVPRISEFDGVVIAMY